MRSLAILVGVAALSVATLTSCSMITADDMHQRGGTDSFLRGDTSQYRTVDNAIYDVLVERYGKTAVKLGEAPEKEYHHWFVRMPIVDHGLQEWRTVISGQPVRDPRTDEYTANILAHKMLRVQDYGGVQPVTEFGKARWVEGGNNTKLQAAIFNEVQAKVDAWEAKGFPSHRVNRREDYLNRREGGGK